MNNTHHGLVWSLSGLTLGCFEWFMANIGAINAVMQFLVLTVSLAAGLYGLRKLLRK